MPKNNKSQWEKENDTLSRWSLVILFLILVIIASVTLSCSIEEQNRGLGNDSNAYINNLHYYKDKRSNLCFAVVYDMTSLENLGGLTLTNVPCTKEVEKLIP